MPLAVALVLTGLVAVSSISKLGRYSQRILEENYRSVLAAQRMKDALERLEDLAVRPLITGEHPPDSENRHYRQQFEAELRAAEGNVTEVGERKILEELRKRWTRFDEQLDRVSRLSAGGNARLPVQVLETEAAALRENAQALLDMNQDAMVRKSDRAQHEATEIGRILVLTALIALLIGVSISSFVTTRLLEPLRTLTRAVARLGEGDFETRAHVAGHDEIAALAEDINKMATRLRQYQRSSLGELLLAQESAQAVIDSLPDPAFVFDPGGNVLNVNLGAEAILGLKIEAGGGYGLDQLEPELRNALQRLRIHVLSGKGASQPLSFNEAVRISTPTGDRFFLPSATPVHSEDGAITGATVILQDVTRLRRADEWSTELVSTAADQFRTPLTSARMAIHLCSERIAGPLTESQADLLHAAREECDRLQTIVDELSDLARLQKGKIELHLTRVSPLDLIQAVVDACRSPAEERHLILDSDVQPDLPSVLADRDRMQLVLSTLLTEAMRVTLPGGQITVRAKETTEGVIRFEIVQAGAAKEHDSNLKQFADSGDSEQRPLGSSITKPVIEAHGGAMGFDSPAGQEAILWFTLPIQSA